jgi:hypothetical protein
MMSRSLKRKIGMPIKCLRLGRNAPRVTSDAAALLAAAADSHN